MFKKTAKKLKDVTNKAEKKSYNKDVKNIYKNLLLRANYNAKEGFKNASYVIGTNDFKPSLGGPLFIDYRIKIPTYKERILEECVNKFKQLGFEVTTLNFKKEATTITINWEWCK